MSLTGFLFALQDNGRADIGLGDKKAPFQLLLQ